MSEDEIIKYLENVIKTIKESDMLFDEPANIRCGLKMSGAIQGLLDLYQKEKEKNKRQAEHIKNINKRNENQRMQLKLLQAHRLKKYMIDNYISKDKIREILEYYGHTPADNPDTTIAFYSDIKKLLEANNEKQM